MFQNVSSQSPDVENDLLRGAGQWGENRALTSSALSTFTQPTLSIVVPTRNEVDNIDELVRRLEQALSGVSAEIVFVDDSNDQTPQAIEAVSLRAQLPIVLIHRSPEQQIGGLGGAVVEGLRVARAPWVCVMDADLQHPPELIPELLDRANRDRADLVLASRYDKHSSHQGLGRARTLVSRGLHAIARVMLPGKIHHVSDPLTGYFLVRRAAIDADKLHPRGFKILLEILIRFPELRIAEIPFQFGSRYAGKSKASTREAINYLSHLWSLRFGDNAGRLLAFALVGASGILVNSMVLALATEWVGIYYLTSLFLATAASTIWNFGLTEWWVYSDRSHSSKWLRRFGLFFVMNNAALLLRGPLVFTLTSALGVHYLASNLISLVAFTLLRFGLADNVIWTQPKPQGAKLKPAIASQLRRVLPIGKQVAASKKMFSYDIHGIVTVQSEVALPELQRFLSTETVEHPTISVQIRWVPRRLKEQASPSSGRRILYRESVGNLGFAAQIDDASETIEIVASPLLRWSPHVLYTNLVEPILRWTFVQKGYALVHAACMAFGDKAYLVTARTDTGKTTTLLRMLRTLQRQWIGIGAAFLSDDLTLVSPDGRVMPYPKPMTISHHTVQAVNPKALTRRERLALLVQSRVHSRSGRRFAFLLAKTHLPVATINTIVQLLIPPPKYDVQRLIPSVKIATEARLTGLFVIERFWTGGEASLKENETLEILLNNCEDAYGFPPYESIKEFLYKSNDHDLRTMESAIIAQALKDLPGTLICSSNLGWSQNILAQVIDTFTFNTAGQSAQPALAVASAV